MKTRTSLMAALCLLVVGLLAPVQAEESDCGCKPDFREISDEVMRVEMGAWTLYFNVALIGCANELSQITEEQMHALRAEFQEPEDWSNVTLIVDHGDAGLRAKVTARVNEVLGAPIVSAVLFHHLRLLDHIE